MTQKTSQQAAILIQMGSDNRVPRSAIGYIDKVGNESCSPAVRLDSLNMLNRYIPELVEKYRSTLADRAPILEHVKCEYCDAATDINDPTVTHRAGAEPIWICPTHS